jgi:putative RecB family exonuclease
VPRKPTLSPSRITTYLACPVKYIWTYVDGRGKWYLRSKSYYSFGSTLHKVMERFHDNGDVGVTTVGDALRVYEESWIDAGYSSPEEMQEAYGEGKEIIEANIAEELKRDPGIKTLAVEKMLSYDMGSFSLIGRIDRLDEHPDGMIEIVDYKSGRGSVTSEQVESDLAMACYQLMVRKLFPDRKVVATIHALRAKEKQKASYSHSDADIQQFECDILELGKQILATSIEDYVPSVKPICGECDFLPLCRKDKNFEYEQS